MYNHVIGINEYISDLVYLFHIRILTIDNPLYDNRKYHLSVENFDFHYEIHHIGLLIVVRGHDIPQHRVKIIPHLY